MSLRLRAVDHDIETGDDHPSLAEGDERFIDTAAGWAAFREKVPAHVRDTVNHWELFEPGFEVSTTFDEEARECVCVVTGSRPPPSGRKSEKDWQELATYAIHDKGTQEQFETAQLFSDDGFEIIVRLYVEE